MRMLRCVRGQFLYLPTFAGDLNGSAAGIKPTQPTLFWVRCIPHETRYRKTGKATVAAIMRRFMSSIYHATLEDGGWRTGVAGLRRYYCTKAPPQFRCHIPRRIAYKTIEVLTQCSMIERGPDGLRATRDFRRMQEGEGGFPITSERLAAVPVCLLVPCFPEPGETCIDDGDAGIARIQRDRSLGLRVGHDQPVIPPRERALAAHRAEMQRFRANSPRTPHGEGVACTKEGVGEGVACTLVRGSRAHLVVVSGEAPEVVSGEGVDGRLHRPCQVGERDRRQRGRPLPPLSHESF
jgi:hypothetical protein